MDAEDSYGLRIDLKAMILQAQDWLVRLAYPSPQQALLHTWLAKYNHEHFQPHDASHYRQDLALILYEQWNVLIASLIQTEEMLESSRQ